MAKVFRNEDVSITYDKEAGKIKIIGTTFEVELSASKLQMINVYSGHEGYGKAKVRLS